MIEDAQLLPWVLGGVSAIVHALFVAYLVQTRGRLRDADARLNDMRESRDEWRRLYLDCEQQEDERQAPK